MRLLAGNTYQQNGRTTPAPDRFTLINGQPQTIALQYTSGKRVPSRIPNAPDQAMYTLSDGRRAYFPLEVGQMIDELRLAPGQPFTICKYGPRDWDVQYAHSSDSAAERPTAPAPRPQPQPRPAPQPLPPAARVNGGGEDAGVILERSYARAIDITVAAVEIARAKGLTFLPTHEGLQACAATLFIDETRRLQQ